MEAFQQAVSGLREAELKQQQQQQQLLGKASSMADLMDMSPTSSPTTQEQLRQLALTPDGGHSGEGASTHDDGGDDALLMMMLLDRPDAGGDSGLSGDSMQLKQGAAAGSAQPAGGDHDSSPTSTRQQQQQPQQQAPQQELFTQLMQQQTLLQRVQAVNAQLQEQHDHDGDDDVASPGCSVAIIAAGGAAACSFKPLLPMKPPMRASAVDQPAGKKTPPAALARGFGSFFLAPQEEAAAAAAAAAAADTPSDGVPAAAAATATEPPAAAGADDVARNQQQQQGECSDIMLDLLDSVVERFTTQRVSSPSTDGTPCAGDTSQHAPNPAPMPAVSDSCSPSNPGSVLPPPGFSGSGAAAGAIAGGSSAQPACCKHTVDDLDRELLGDVEGEVDLADLFDEDSTDPDEHPATAAGGAVAGLSGQAQLQRQLEPQLAAVGQLGAAAMLHVGGAQVQQSALRQQHLVPLSGLQCLTPRGVISRPTVTTGATHSHNNNYGAQPAVQGSSAAIVSTWQQQQQQASHTPPLSSSSSGRVQQAGSTCDDPAVTGNTEEDEMLQQVLPQLTAAMEREAAAAAESESRGTGATGGTRSTADRGHSSDHYSSMQHSSRVVVTGGLPLPGPHMQYSTQQQQQQQHEQTGSPFARRDTQRALRPNLDMPGFCQPLGAEPQPIMGQPQQQQFGRHSLSGPPPGMRHSGPGGSTLYPFDPLFMPQQQPQQPLGSGGLHAGEGGGGHPGLPRYPSHPGSLQYQQQQQQQPRIMMMPQQQQHQQQQGVHPAGWGPPAPPGFLQPPRSHYAGGQQQQPYMQQQQPNMLLPRVHSAPAVPQGAAMGPGPVGPGGIYGPAPAWGPPAQPQHMGYAGPAPGQGGYSSGPHHLSRTSSGGAGMLPAPAGGGLGGPPGGSGGGWPTAGSGGLPPLGAGRPSQDHLPPGYNRHSQDHPGFSRQSQDHPGGGFYSAYGPAGAGDASIPPQRLSLQGGGGSGGVGGSMVLPPSGRTISSSQLGFNQSMPVTTTGRSSAGGGAAGPADPAAAAAAGGVSKPPAKTGTGRPRGRPRKHPLPGTAAAAAAPVGQVPLSFQQQQQQWQAGYNPADRSGSGSSQGSGGSLLQRKRSSSFSGLEDPTTGLKFKVQRSDGGPASAGLLLSQGSGGSGGGSGAATLPKAAVQKKPKAAPKPTLNKDGVIVPPPAGADMAARGWPPFSDLVVAGTFPPGTYNFSCGTVPSVIATVTPNGLIRWNEETYQSISSFALAVVRTVKPTRQACDGWRECRLKGVKIHEWRAAFLEKRPPPAVPQEAIVVAQQQ